MMIRKVLTSSREEERFNTAATFKLINLKIKAHLSEGDTSKGEKKKWLPAEFRSCPSAVSVLLLDAMSSCPKKGQRVQVLEIRDGDFP